MHDASCMTRQHDASFTTRLAALFKMRAKDLDDTKHAENLQSALLTQSFFHSARNGSKKWVCQHPTQPHMSVVHTEHSLLRMHTHEPQFQRANTRPDTRTVPAGSAVATPANLSGTASSALTDASTQSSSAAAFIGMTICIRRIWWVGS